MAAKSKFTVRIIDDTARPLVEHLPIHGDTREMEPWNVRQPVQPEPLFSPFEEACVVAEKQRQEEHRQARVRGEEEGLAAAQQMIEEIRNAYGESIARLDDATRGVTRMIATDIVDLALAVAQEIIGRSVSSGREQLLDAIERALASMPADQEIEVKMNPTDYEYLRERGFAAQKPLVRLSIDDAIVAGGCEVISNHRVVDATIQTRLQAVRGALISLLSSNSEETDPDASGEEPQC